MRGIVYRCFSILTPYHCPDSVKALVWRLRGRCYEISLALLRDTSEAEVAEYLDRTYPSNPRPPWVKLGDDGPSLYIVFYRDLSEEWEPEEYADLTRRFGGEPAVAVMADVSGRIPGDDQALEFLTGLLGHFSRAAMDDYSDYLWSPADLQAGHRVAGHRFFDDNGWYNEQKTDG